MLSTTQFWLSIGFLGQGFFSMRFIVQWVASERRKESVIPLAFWFFSIAGGLTLFAYALHRRDPVFMVGEATGTAIYLRNLYLIWRAHRRVAAVDAQPTRPAFWRQGTSTLRGFLLVAVLTFTVLGVNVGARHLITNDDTRFPVLARDVLAKGHWLLPELPDGYPHLIKPPLVVWLIALTSWSTGAVSVRTAVLPSVLEAAGVVLLTYWIGCRLSAPAAGVVAGLTALTTVGVYSMAQSSMPDMAQLFAMTAALGTFTVAEFSGTRSALVAFYALTGVATLTKGAAGLVPLAIALVYSITRYGVAGGRRLVSVPGLLVLMVLAVPWWIVAAVVGRQRFVRGVVADDQLLYYFHRSGWTWRVVTAPFGHALAVLMPWCVLLPFAIRRVVRQSGSDTETRGRVRFLLVWLVTVFIIMAASAQQRERYYLPLVPPAALMIGWWYSTLTWRHRARAFAGAWLVVVAAGAIVGHGYTKRYNAETDLDALRSILARAPRPVYAYDVPELVLSFNLDRSIAAGNYGDLERRLRQGEAAYLVISDRALPSVPDALCLHTVATGLATRRRFTVLAPGACGAGRGPEEMTTNPRNDSHQ